MKFNFTEDQLKELIAGNPDADKWYQAMLSIFPKYDIVTEPRVAGFIAQCAHESNNFKSLEENLNYSESALNSVFSRYFGTGKRNAAEYARNPEKIANYVYMDEFRSKSGALGNTQPGDGWRFRGRGLKQLTGRNNYTAFGKTVNMTAEEAAEYVASPKGAIESACWFWHDKKLNAVADAGDIVKMTKIINGGDIGLDDRKKRWEHALKVLGGDFTPTVSLETLKRGSSGSSVKKLQAALGVATDGSFGPGTETALKSWQSKNGLTPDGIAGPITLAKLLK